MLRLCFSSSADRTAKASGAEPVVEDLVGPTGSGDAAASSLSDKQLKQAQQQIHPKALFPWRHETMDNPLPRLTSGTPESRYNTSAMVPRPTQNFIASAFLGYPAWQVLLGDWRAQLAESASYAFTRGVAGIISNVYHVPYRGVLRDDQGKETTTLTFDSSLGASSSEANQDGTRTDAAASTAPEREHDDSEDDESPDVEYMLDQPLRKLFQSAHEHGRDQLLVRLETTPVRAAVYSLFCLPFVSRGMAARDPTILERMRHIVFPMSVNSSEEQKRSTDGASVASPSAFSSMYEHVQSQVDRNDRLETTVELQVLVECEEVFQVVDRTTGVVVQGAGAAGGEGPDEGAGGSSKRNVWHLVSLEATSITTFTDAFPYLPDTVPGNWIITDIDDLLGPKKWYHPK